MQYAINHMNTEHKDANLTIAKYYGKLKSGSSAIITKIEPKTLHLLVDNEINVEVPFSVEVTEDNIKDEIIALLKHARANMTEENLTKEDLAEEVKDHMNSLKTVILATIDAENNPQASYSPFISFEGKNYIYLSKIAEHYSNLENNPTLEVLFLADESASKILTARTRVKFKSVAKKLPRDIAEFEIIMDKFQENVGNTMKMIRTMGDFNLFEIEFIEGRYVKGFGQAYKIIPKGNSFTTEHITFDAGVPHEIK
jgi:HugZ family heme oxygenase